MGRLSKVKETATKDGVLSVYITGQEKWNWPDSTGKSHEGPNANGYYDVEGHSWTDVNLKYRLNLFRKEDRKEWWGNFTSWLEDIKEMFLGKNKIFRTLSYIIDTVSTIGTTQYYWGITITSLSVYKSELAQDRAFEALEGDRPNEDLSLRTISKEYHEWFDAVRVKEESIISELTKAEILEELFSHTTPIGSGIYVDNDDKTSIYVDEDEFRFDLKDGFSDFTILTIISIWAERVLGIDVAVLNLGNNSNETVRAITSAKFTIEDMKGE